MQEPSVPASRSGCRRRHNGPPRRRARQLIPSPPKARPSLQACRLLVLANIKSAGPPPAAFAITTDVGHVTRADRMDHDVEAGRRRAERSHRCLDRGVPKSALGGNLPIECQHLGADVHHGDQGSGRGVQRRLLPPAAGGQAQHASASDARPQPAGRSTTASGRRKSSSWAGR